MRKTFTVTIETVKGIEDKYPNFRINYDSPEDFIRAVMRDFAGPALGYTITYKEND